MPKVVDTSEIVGTWVTRYDDPTFKGTAFAPAEFKLGVETLTFSADGTYTHTFTSPTYQYVSQPAQWSIDNAFHLDSPKLKMEKFKYFALGTLRADSDVDKLLLPELDDIFRYQDAGIDPAPVYYPSSGFVYLYLRRCWGELMMQQMGEGLLFDPDSVTLINPPFRRQ